MCLPLLQWASMVAFKSNIRKPPTLWTRKATVIWLCVIEKKTKNPLTYLLLTELASSSSGFLQAILKSLYKVFGPVMEHPLQHAQRSVEEYHSLWSSWRSDAMALSGYMTLMLTNPRWLGQPAYKDQHQFHEESSGGWKNEARSLVSVSVLSFRQCCNMVDWVRGCESDMRKLSANYPKSSLHKQMQEENWGN